MRPIALAELAAWIGAEAPAAAARVEIGRVVTDSRKAGPGDLFVALRGARADGHDFLAEVERKGAAAALVGHRVPDLRLPQLVVGDALQALAAMAAALRARRTTRVLALTGSNGKTTVKTLLAAVLERVGRTYATPGNRNNELGMPLTVIEQPEDADYAVFELGAGQPGDIAHLAAIARPEVALVNNVGPAHLERLGSLLGVARTKGEIYAALPAGGVAVLNADDPFCTWFEDRLRGDVQRLRFGLAMPAEVAAEEVCLLPDGIEAVLRIGTRRAPLRMARAGRHNLMNALAAAAMAHAVGVPLEAIAAGLAAAPEVEGRARRIPLAEGGMLIDDSYNANPGSLAAAIALLAAQPSPRLLVLGDMLELGPQARRMHFEVGRQARQAGIEALFCCGELALAAAEGFGPEARHFATQDALLAALRAGMGGFRSVLVKGSRGARMERVVAALAEPRGNGHAA
ncbi:MAG: UDP-N-acetylmuramoyl-tripeptide--D-alanyl-D-alanine ligase [Lysobacteraceae bacterium]|nr:MAG: UDP-N-acetylmuramoyl-tripeptide--D-alanyl-D-alanine ligase [Xanthomonadaceae bacterium]